MMNNYKPEGINISSIENREAISSLTGLRRAMETGAILESTALLCDGEMNLHIDLHGIVGIIPRSEVLYDINGEQAKDIAVITRVGKPICFKVMSIAEHDGRPIALLSRREAQLECYQNYINDLIPGDIVTSRVTHMEKFGAFVDIGCGIISLLSVDCISVSRISHPSDRLHQGMVLKTVIKSIDPEAGRVFVTLRELLGTWEENASLFSSGQTVAGIVRSVESYGIFVELMPNLAGLAEIRDDFAGTPFDRTEFAENTIGKLCAVYIKSIIPERMKIKLVLIDSYKGESTKPKLHYFVNTDKILHINEWKYSPEGAAKQVETVF